MAFVYYSEMRFMAVKLIKRRESKMIFLLIIAGSSIWVYFDAKAIGVRKGLIKGFTDMGPGGWFFASLLVWIVGFPAYLATRGKYKKLISESANPK